MHRRDHPTFNPYAGEKTGAIIMGVVTLLFIVGVALIISGLTS